MSGRQAEGRTKCPFRICTKQERPEPEALQGKRLTGQSRGGVCPLCTAKLKGKTERKGKPIIGCLPE